MAEFAIESNGRLEKTAIYFNGEQIGGVKEVFLNLDEDGTFDSIIQYEGKDKNIYTKNIFSDYLENLKTVPPSFTEEEARSMFLFTVVSDGDIENTLVYENDEESEGIVSVLVHIKGAETKKGIKSFFKTKNKVPDRAEFKAEITFRNDDDTIETEDIF